MPKLKDNQFTDRQDKFIYNLVTLGNNPTQAARLAGYADAKQSAFNLVHSPKMIARIRQERQKLYQTDLAPIAVRTLRSIMEDETASSASRVASARTCLELAGDIGKHSQANARNDKSLSDMSVEELSSIITKLEDEAVKQARDVTPEKE